MSFTSSLGYTPVYQINRGGADITKQFNDRVTLIKVVSTNGGGNTDTLSISLDDRDWSIATPATDDEGPPSMEVYLGYRGKRPLLPGNVQHRRGLSRGHAQDAPPRGWQRRLLEPAEGADDHELRGQDHQRHRVGLRDDGGA